MNTSTNNTVATAPKLPLASTAPKAPAKAPSKAAAPAKGRKAVAVATGKPKPASKPAKKASKAPSKPAKATKAAKASKAPAKRAAPAKKAAAPAKKVAPKLPAKKTTKPVNVGEYNVKTGPTQGRISGYHIDEERPTKHGVTKRSAGTIGGRLWAIFDRMAKGAPKDLLIAKVKESTLVDAFNANKVVIEFYYWRRFNGVRGRGKKQKVA